MTTPVSSACEVRVVLVGCGRWGQNWAKTLFEMGALAGICEPFLGLHSSIQERFPGIPVVEKLEEALNTLHPDAFVIATPAPTHSVLASISMLAAKPLLVEKPLTLSSLEASQLVTLADSTQQLLLVGHVLMYHPIIQWIRQQIDAGVAGDILSVHCTRVNLGTVRNEEDCWWSFAPHDLSLLDYLLDGQTLFPQQAFALPELGRPAIADTVYARFETPKKQQASIHVSWLSPVKRHEVIVTGTRKIIVFDDAKPLPEKLQWMDYSLSRTPENTIHSLSKSKLSSVFPCEALPVEFSEAPLKREAMAFVEAVLNRKNNVAHSQPLFNNAEQGLRVVSLLEQVQSLYAPASKHEALSSSIICQAGAPG